VGHPGSGAPPTARKSASPPKKSSSSPVASSDDGPLPSAARRAVATNLQAFLHDPAGNTIELHQVGAA